MNGLRIVLTPKSRSQLQCGPLRFYSRRNASYVLDTAAEGADPVAVEIRILKLSRNLRKSPKDWPAECVKVIQTCELERIRADWNRHKPSNPVMRGLGREESRGWPDQVRP